MPWHLQPQIILAGLPVVQIQCDRGGARARPNGHGLRVPSAKQVQSGIASRQIGIGGDIPRLMPEGLGIHIRALTILGIELF